MLDLEYDVGTKEKFLSVRYTLEDGEVDDIDPIVSIKQTGKNSFTFNNTYYDYEYDNVVKIEIHTRELKCDSDVGELVYYDESNYVTLWET